MKKFKFFLLCFIFAFILFFFNNNVIAQDNQNMVVLNYPIINYQYKDKMYIEGYFKTDEKDTKLLTLIDDNIIDIAYDNFEKENNIGFYKTIDLTNIKDGHHDIAVKLYSSDNNLLAETKKTFNIKKYNGEVKFNYPITNYDYKDKIYIEGIFNTDCPNKSVEVFIDDTKIDYLNFIDEKNMFYTVISTGDIPDGQHEIKALLKDNTTNEMITSVSKKINVKQYDFDLLIKYPMINYQYSDIMYIEGESSESLSDIEVKMFIDNVYINNSFKKTNNIFNQTYNLKNIIDGEHELKISLYKDNKEIISKSKKFKMKKYDSKINFEFPITNYLYNNNMYVQGWALTNCKDTNLIIKIDGKEEKFINRYLRNDLASYGIELSNKDGFYGTYDTTSLVNGKHKISAELIDVNTGELLASESKEFNLKKFNASFSFDYPLIDYTYKDNMYVQGIVDTDVSDSIIEMYIDNSLVVDEAKRYQTSIVGNYIKENNGFFETLNISNLKDGEHILKVQIKSKKFMNEIVASKEIKFNLKKFDGSLVLESPTTSLFSNEMILTGWEMSELSDSYIKVFIDGIDITNTLASKIERTERNDILSSGIYGGSTTNTLPGFKSNIDLSLVGAGDHIICLKLYTKLNEEIDSITKKIYVYKNVSFGIDVSYHNTITNWNSIKNDGINYAFIRAAYRGYGFKGTLSEDTKFSSFVHDAKMAGIKIGAYVYSQAINENEAREEANKGIFLVNREGGKNTFDLPIVFDTEFTPCWINNTRCGRADHLTKDERTRIAKAFLETIKNAGYTPMIYSNKSFLYNNLDMNQLSEYEVWMANFLNESSAANPLSHPSNYTEPYQVWQYYSEGKISGINGNVDMNIFYKQY